MNNAGINFNTHGGPRRNSGGARPGAGRPRGSRNRLTTEMLEVVGSMRDAKATIGNGELPLEFLLEVMRDPARPVELRIEAAKAAAPYIHPKMPQAGRCRSQGEDRQGDRGNRGGSTAPAPR